MAVKHRPVELPVSVEPEAISTLSVPNDDAGDFAIVVKFSQRLIGIVCLSRDCRFIVPLFRGSNASVAGRAN